MRGGDATLQNGGHFDRSTVLALTKLKKWRVLFVRIGMGQTVGFRKCVELQAAG